MDLVHKVVLVSGESVLRSISGNDGKGERCVIHVGAAATIKPVQVPHRSHSRSDPQAFA